MPKLVEAIMEAEKEAARIIEEAEEEAKRIIEEARASPVEVKPFDDVDSEIQEIIEKAKAEAERLRDNALKKMDLLVDEVIKEVLEGEWRGGS